jgi:lipopolysaccharide export system protein LptA
MQTEILTRAFLLLLLLPVPGAAQLTDLRLPISLDADSTDYDGKSSMLMFRGLRLTQGNIGIEADEGRASNLDFEDSVWQFSGNVVIDVENGHIECDTADLQFSNHQLALATIGGTPATFELNRPGSEETTYAEAGKLRYDLTSGVIEFSEDATITEGGNQISSNYLIYNIVEQRINAQGSPDGDGKVRITYTPQSNGDDGESDAAEPEGGDAEPDAGEPEGGDAEPDAGDSDP